MARVSGEFASTLTDSMTFKHSLGPSSSSDDVRCATFCHFVVWTTGLKLILDFCFHRVDMSTERRLPASTTDTPATELHPSVSNVCHARAIAWFLGKVRLTVLLGCP
jgi:hypothetical protein